METESEAHYPAYIPPTPTGDADVDLIAEIKSKRVYDQYKREHQAQWMNLLKLRQRYKNVNKMVNNSTYGVNNQALSIDWLKKSLGL